MQDHTDRRCYRGAQRRKDVGAFRAYITGATVRLAREPLFIDPVKAHRKVERIANRHAGILSLEFLTGHVPNDAPCFRLLLAAVLCGALHCVCVRAHKVRLIQKVDKRTNVMD